MERLGKSMSGSDMKAWMPHANVLTYKQLGNLVRNGASLDDVLGEAGVCVLLYQISDTYGHWTLVFRRGQKYDTPRMAVRRNADGERVISTMLGPKRAPRPSDVVECFDSYGYTPDDEFSFVPRDVRARTNQDYRYLTQLLYDSPYRVEFNEIPLQAESPDITTCGRHCIARLAFNNLSIAQYQRKFKRYDMDRVVALAIPNRPPM